MNKERLIVGISGASGIAYGVQLLRVLRDVDEIETHVIISPAARQTIAYETDHTFDDITRLADETHPFRDIAAAPSSGSFKTLGMIICPCSIKTLSGVALASDDNLIVRAADVALKERRRLVLVPRETPLHAGHLKLMVQASENGAVIAPPVPAFYSRPETIDDIVAHTVYRLLDLFDIDVADGEFQRWPEGKRRSFDPVGAGEAIRLSDGSRIRGGRT